MQRFFIHALTAAGLVAAAGLAQAHDTWLMPATFQPPAGQPISATISAGDGLKALVPPKRSRVKSLELVDANGRQPFKRWKDQKTAAQLGFGAPAAGVACLAYSTVDVEIDIKPALVDEYLAEIQPTPDITEAWASQRARGEPWHERYAKDAKTCFRTGTGDAGWPQLAVLGQTLEIVPKQDPTRLKQGERFDVVLQHQGQPLANVALRLFSGKSDEQLLRTDAEGRVSFALKRGGPHLIATTVLNLPAAPGAPWTSRFATLGFSVAE